MTPRPPRSTLFPTRRSSDLSQDDLLYIAMRYVSGTDMRQMIKKRGRILPATALFLVGQAARALDAAHRQGLVDRKSTRLNSSHPSISYAVFCLKKKRNSRKT